MLVQTSLLKNQVQSNFNIWNIMGRKENVDVSEDFDLRYQGKLLIYKE